MEPVHYSTWCEPRTNSEVFPAGWHREISRLNRNSFSIFQPHVFNLTSKRNQECCIIPLLEGGEGPSYDQNLYTAMGNIKRQIHPRQVNTKSVVSTAALVKKSFNMCTGPHWWGRPYRGFHGQKCKVLATDAIKMADASVVVVTFD